MRLAALCLLACSLVAVSFAEQLCWEQCFQVEDQDEERFREIYDDFYRMGMEARRLKNMYGVNGTAIMLDSTLSAKNPLLPAAEFYESPRAKNNSAYAIWEFQKNLAVITMILMGAQEDHNPIYLIQFDQNGANTCEEFHCLQACEADYIMDSELNIPEIESYKDGNIEAACSLSKKFMQSTLCTAHLRNEMAIAFLNSGMHYHRYRHGSSSESDEDGAKPCYAHFDTRMAVGTHVARWHQIDSWSTNAARPFYFHDNVYTMTAARHMRSCLRTRCCPTGQDIFDENISGDVCKKTEGEVGDTILDYPGHKSYGR